MWVGLGILNNPKFQELTLINLLIYPSSQSSFLTGKLIVLFDWGIVREIK